MKLNIGCGHRRIEGYTGVDAVQRPGTDLLAPADKIPLDDGSVDEIMAIHLFEHFWQWEAPVALAEWKRLLRSGGRLILELPNLEKACQNIIDGRGGKHPDQMGMWALYGDPREADPFMAHRWAYTPASLSALLSAAGFVDVVERPTQFHPVGREWRDMRIEARRP